jgi:transporter family-2 protein
VAAKLLFGILAAAIGVAFSLQSGVVTALARRFDSFLLATLVSFAIGTVVLVGAVLATGQPVANVGRGAPWWMWVAGGSLGAFAVASTMFLVPRLGVAVMTVIIIAGQLTAAALIDHFGAFGVEQRPIGWTTAGGLALAFLAAILVSTA